MKRATLVFAGILLITILSSFLLPTLALAQIEGDPNIVGGTMQGVSNTNVAGGQGTIPSGGGNSCAWGVGWFCSLVEGLFLLIYQASGLLLGAVAFLFDLSIKFTLVDLFSNSPGLVGDAQNPGVVGAIWSVLRDFANMSFIFILLYIAIRTILGQASGNTMRWLFTVVVVAILLNFSLFFTKLFIDVGNILALLFYKALGGNNISNIFVSGLHLQNFGLLRPDVSLSVKVFGFLLGTAGLLVVSFILVSAAITMLVRSVVLIFVMILSPFAFAAYSVDKGKEWSTKWFHYLTNYAFVAPIYLFFLYLNARFIYAMQQYFGAVNQGSGGVINAATYTGAVERMAAGTVARSDLAPILGFIVIVIGLLIGHYLTKTLAKGAADFGAGAFNKLSGLALGGVAGLGGGFFRGTVGMGADKLAGKLQKSSLAGTRTGRLLIGASKKVADKPFDARNLNIVKDGAKKAGLNLGAPAKGYVGQRDEVAKKEKEYIESLKGNKAAQQRYASLLKNPISGAQTTAGQVVGAGAGFLSFVRGRRPGEAKAAADFEKEGKAKEAEKPIREARNDLQNRLNAVNRTIQQRIQQGLPEDPVLEEQKDIYAEAIESLDNIKTNIKEGKPVEAKDKAATAARLQKEEGKLEVSDIVSDIRTQAKTKAKEEADKATAKTAPTPSSPQAPWSARRPQSGRVNQPSNPQNPGSLDEYGPEIH